MTSVCVIIRVSIGFIIFDRTFVLIGCSNLNREEDSHPPDEINTNMNRLIQRMFDNRGYTDTFLHEINDPSFGRLQNIDAMAVRLHEIYDSGLEITVFPDFDMDGIAAGTLGFSGFAELGFHVNLFIPDPDKGYGVHTDDIEELLFRFPNTKVIITCDTGINAIKAAQFCRSRGIELLVTDHHIQDEALDVPIIVDPMAIGETYPHPEICGAFVLWQVLQRYADCYCNYFMQDQMRRLRVFAGIGTVSDCMPVLYENRQLVKDAVNICRLVYGDGTTNAVGGIDGCNTYKLAFWGLYNLMKAFESKGVITSVQSIDEGFFGFYLAPMFNSVKRMGGDMNSAFGVFFTSSSKDCVDMLYQLNLDRRSQVGIEMDAVSQAKQPFAPLIFYSNAREGILGLIATQLMNQTGMPVFVMKDRGEDYHKGDRYHGSARCPEWYPGRKHLPDFVHTGGHAHSFGWGVSNHEDVERLFEFLKKDIEQVRSTVHIEEPVPDFVISTDWSGDTGIDISLFNEYLDEIANYKPFGVGFKEPSCELRFRNRDVLAWKTIGSSNQHLKICLPNGFDVLCWNQGHMIDARNKDGWHIVTGTLDRSTFKGEVCVNFKGVLHPDTVADLETE